MLNLDKALTIKGWMSLRELMFLATRAPECSIIIEVGSYYGRSARAFADNMNGARLYCIDPWNGPLLDGDNQHQIGNVNTYVFNTFKENMEPHFSAGKVVPLRGKLNDFKYLFEHDADFIFLDGDHKYESVRSDIENAFTMLKPGGILAGHDYAPGWPEIIKAVDEFFPKIERAGESIWWTRL